MNTALLIKHFLDPRFISIEGASTKIQDLNTNLQTIQSYCNHHEETLTEKEQTQQQEKSKKIQDEIDYYKTSIFCAQQTYQDDEHSPFGYSLIEPIVHGDEKDEEIRLLKQQVARLEQLLSEKNK
jgi:hypothetical protein